MLSKFDLKKVAKKLLRKRPMSESLEIMHPKRDWSIGVLVALLMVLSITVWAGSTYLETRTAASADEIAAEVESVVYRETNVTEALRIRAERRTAVNYFLENAAPIVTEEETSTTTPDAVDDEEGDDSVTNNIDGTEEIATSSEEVE